MKTSEHQIVNEFFTTLSVAKVTPDRSSEHFACCNEQDSNSEIRAYLSIAMLVNHSATEAKTAILWVGLYSFSCWFIKSSIYKAVTQLQRP